MKAVDAVRLNEWIRTNRANIIGQKRCQNELADMAKEALGCKVSVSTIRSVLQYNGIQTRQRSATAKRIDGLEEQVQQLRSALIKVVTTVKLPEWLAKEIATEELDDEIRVILTTRKVA